MTRECHVRFCERLGGRFPGSTYHFGMKAHIGVDAESGLVHTVRGTAGNVNDVVEANSLLHGEETDAFGDAGYQGVDKRPDARAGVNWHVAMKPGKRRVLDQSKPHGALVSRSSESRRASGPRSSIRSGSSSGSSATPRSAIEG